MAFLELKEVKISGLSVCVPKEIESNRNIKHLLSVEEADKFIQSTGIEYRRIADNNICTSDMCFVATEKLINELGWEKSEIDFLIFVTQTPDYILPSTSSLLQYKLGLNQECFCLDISLGCSGWVFGLNIASSLINSGLKKGLLLAGDTIHKICSTKDKSTYPLFGDAGTATAVEYQKDSEGFKFHLSTDGSGYQSIIIPDGGFRNSVSKLSFEEENHGDYLVRNKLQLSLDGMNVFSFGISKAPETINKLLDKFKIEKDKVDYFIFHQANLFMNEKIRKKLNIPVDKVPYSLKDFGNTSSATIPLTIVTQTVPEKKNFIACGFGVGLSWGSVHFNLNNCINLKLIEI